MISLLKSEQESKVASSISLSKSYVTFLDSIDFVKPLCIKSFASVHPKCSNIIAPERITDPGLTLSLPAYFGAVPWVASKIAWPV